MSKTSPTPLRTGFTTGACATAAAAAAGGALITGRWEKEVAITLPRGQDVTFNLALCETGDCWARAGVIKDAGDDPDVTHGAMIVVTLRYGATGSGVTFHAGEGVGTVTKPGLPIPPGEPAINPVPRQMMTQALTDLAQSLGHAADFEVEVSIPGGAEIARDTWNGRLGIEGGLSILGTTGIVRPFSCAAWIASIHRGIDVARAGGLTHAVGSTGATSEATAQAHFGLPDHAMLDMGDFAGGLLKYLRRHPIARLTIAGGFGKMTKLAQGALDLHSARSQVDFSALAEWSGSDVAEAVSFANTAQHALSLAGPALAQQVADRARATALGTLGDAPVSLDTLIIDRQGQIIAMSEGSL